ncbi:MarR family transcriptional regulator [Fulvivirgaceae bacterium BMA12]|uniref:MarR family transcriptional regulator n=1 Tax=Agaribacillus aureus TaxID=3051825 RepID=A0ABT8L5L7_9BACT|nr:MarR family transcriptional regulator [Fulvivirgaceae bacterium BMA12]
MELVLKNALGYIIRNVSLLLMNRINQNFLSEGFDITAEQLRVLVALWDQDEQSQIALGESVGKYKTSVTKLIDGLEKRNLIIRVPSKNDRRSNTIKLTKLGINIRSKLVPIIEKTLSEAQQGISPDELATCKKVLLAIGENLKGTAAAT